jgi:hypothetical protein
MFNTKEEAIEFADEQNDSTLSGLYGISEWVVQRTYKKQH